MSADERKLGGEYKLLYGERKTVHGLSMAARTRNGVFYGVNAEIQVEFA